MKKLLLVALLVGCNAVTEDADVYCVAPDGTVFEDQTVGTIQHGDFYVRYERPDGVDVLVQGYACTVTEMR